jgi:diguanylate cyclase (GGDEF)-like protein
MEKTAAAERARTPPSEEPGAPPAWVAAQPPLAARTGLAVLLVAGRQPPQLTVVNNNSVCQAFQSSATHAHLCDPYCGEAFARAQAAGAPTHYRCHAGLHCFAAPVDLGTGRQLAVIGGRAFLSTEDYRAQLERFRVGDLRLLADPDTFRNIILATPAALDALASRVAELAAEVRGDAEPADKSTPARQQGRAAAATAGAQANAHNGAPPSTHDATQAHTHNNAQAHTHDGAQSGANGGTSVAPAAEPGEVVRLREELAQRVRAAYHLQSFVEQISAAEPGDPYQTVLHHCLELLHSERGSLMIFDEAANVLLVRAAAGPRAEFAQAARVAVGESVAGAAWRAGRPVVVRDAAAAGHAPAPAERAYKSASFICYPIRVAGRQVGVLNVTDKAGGEAYDELDVSLLDLLVPQMALALDRAEWHQKATQFQLLSITDPLTGLVNRRYLEERLSEELERSKRHRFAMSFLMIDIDFFKEYNDQHGHPAGDLALEMTAQCLKSALRSADVAARYGGEEFSVLLPQTNISEAHVIAERIRRRVERTQYPHGKSQPHGAVTVSIGISAFGPRLDTPAQVVAAADHALYVAKSHGKNRVEAYVPPSVN